MLNLGSRFLNFLRPIGGTQLGLVALAAWMGVAASAQPANDNLINAEVLTNTVQGGTDFGTVVSDNSLATAEPNEPSHAGVTPQNTLWYKWTATSDAPVEFDTFNSDARTVLAVYLGTNTDIGNLSLLVANAALHNFNPVNGAGFSPNVNPLSDPYFGRTPSPVYNRPSGVKFNAKRGQIYYIAVGARSAGQTGTITLSWAYVSSGVFRFTCDYYFVSESESDQPYQSTISQSPLGARITVTRLFGSAGKVKVDFALSDGAGSSGTAIRPGIKDRDYREPGSTSLIFDDYEQSKTFLIPVVDDGGIGGGGRSGQLDWCRDFNVSLTAATLDPLEQTNVIAPPRIEMLHSNAVVCILDMDTTPGFRYDPNNPITLSAVSSNVSTRFERTMYRVTEPGRGLTNIVRIPVYRGPDTRATDGHLHYAVDSDAPVPGSNTADNEFDLQAGSDYASPNATDGPASLNPDFDLPYVQGSTGELTWGTGDTSVRYIDIPILGDGLPEFNEDINIWLFVHPGHNEPPDFPVGYVGEATVTILYNDYPAGALDVSHNPDWDISTPDLQRNPMPGANGVVYALSVQSDGKTVIGGKFSTYNGIPRYGVARINFDGSLDHSFLDREGDGIPVTDRDHNYFISCLAPAANGKFVIGGNFPSFGGVTRYNLARINTDGTLDTSMSPGMGAVAVNDSIWAVAVQPDGKVIAAGDFTTAGPYFRSHIARFNTNGTVDVTFDPGTNAINGTIHAVTIASNGKVYIGGEFTSIGGVPRNHIALLETNGIVSTDFIPVVGVDGPVFTLAEQPDGKLLVGGAFGIAELRTRNNFARYNANGTLDLTFDPGTGTDDAVYSIAQQNDGRILIAGLFTEYNQTRRVALARLLPSGELDTSFMDTAYNQFAGPHKPYYNPYVNPKDFLFSIGLQSDGNLMIGGSFHYVGGGRFTDLVRTNDTPLAGGGCIDGTPYTRATYRSRANVTRLLGGDTMGPGSMGIWATNYSVGEELSFIFTRLFRTNGTLGTIEATFSIPPRSGNNTNGIAQSGLDYVYNNRNPEYISSWLATATPGDDVRSLSDGTVGLNNICSNAFGNNYVLGSDDVSVTIADIAGFQGDRSAPYKLDMPSYADIFFLGGENIPLGAALANTSSTLWIRENDIQPGVIQFSSPTYLVDENGGRAEIVLTRTNGSVGQVQVVFATTNGVNDTVNGTVGAVAGIHYVGVTNTVTFMDGKTRYTNYVSVYNRNVSGPDTTVNLYLANPGNGAVLGAVSNAVLTIINDNFLNGHVNLTSVSYATNEDAPALLFTVTRTGGNVGTLEVSYATSNLTAVAGPDGDYTAIFGTLRWNHLETTPRTVAVPLRHDGLVTGDRQFLITLFSPSVAGALGPRTQATATLHNVDSYGQLQFSAPVYHVSENGGYITLNVIRVGGSAETVSASVKTLDDGAYQFLNYLPLTTNLAFGPGVVCQSFSIPILDDGVQDPTNAFGYFGFNVNLSNFSPASAAPSSGPSTALVNIIDVETINHPPGQVDTEFNPSAGFNDDVYSLVLQEDPLVGGAPRIVVGGNFTTANGLPVNRITRLFSDGTLDFGFLAATLGGANGAVRVVLNQSDSRMVLGGAFSTLNNVVRRYLGRLNYDGSLDTTFNPGSGPDGQVYALAETFNVWGQRKLLVGGAFNTYNGTSRGCIICLNEDGTVDLANNLGVGADGAVHAIAVYPTNSLYAGQAIVAGDFTAINGVARMRIARLLRDGSIDPSFDPDGGFPTTVRTLALQPDGRVLVGGSFTSVDGKRCNRLTRLNLDGSVDTSFLVGDGLNGTVDGFNDTVHAIALQPDNRIVVVGQFTRGSSVTRNRITRLLPNGAVDAAINFGTGANNYISTVAIQPDGKFVIGGGFTEVQGLTRYHLARLYGGAVVGSGSFTFDAAAYAVDESGTNVVVTILRTGGTSGPNADASGTNYVDVVLTDGTATANNYVNPGIVSLPFPAGETSMAFPISVLDDQEIKPNLTVNLALANPTAPATLGSQPTAVLTIRNVDSAIQFSTPTYFRAENAIDHVATIEFYRLGSTLKAASVDFLTTTNGTAVPGVNYTPVTNTIFFEPGQTNQFLTIPILATPGVVEGDKTVTMALSNPSGALLLAPFEAVLTIQDVDTAPGKLFFSETNYYVAEAGGYAAITVLRTNGHTGPISIDFSTVQGDATPGLKYLTTNGTLSFAEGEVSQTFTVPILTNNLVEGNETFWVMLSNPQGGASLLNTNRVPVTIIDDDIGISFSTNSAINATYIVSETNSQISLDLYLLNATGGEYSVTYATVDGTAAAGVNFVGDSRTLKFQAGETHKIISLSIKRDPRVTGDLAFNVVLTNATGGAQLAMPSSATVVINDVDTGLSLLSTNAVPTFYVLENSNSIRVTVVRTNASTGTVRVSYATDDGTATVLGNDYTPVSGFLVFTNDQLSNSFTVPIVDNTRIDGDRYFTVSLGMAFPAPPAQLLSPTNATIYILDNDSGVSFSASSYEVLKGNLATITVTRLGSTNSSVSVNYSTQSGGTALPGIDYTPISGTLVFTQGQSSATFKVAALDNTLLEGDRTVLLSLSSPLPANSTTLVSPGAATLTIHEKNGNLVVPAGTSLVSESLAQNGVIEPNETVTVMFAFRNLSGSSNTTDLIATLLATNGVASPDGPQHYGRLYTNGPPAFRPFRFTATGTNGQRIFATFRLTDQGTSVGTNNGEAIFPFTVGTRGTSFTNGALITINDATGAGPVAATPYPSLINVSNVDGVVSKVTLSLNGYRHAAPSDVDALLVSPADQRVLLFANAGNGFGLNRVNLTLDDAATNSLPSDSQIKSGSYRPTAYLPVVPFPGQAPPAPAGGYAGALSAFNSGNPNGTWSLYFMDDQFQDSGAVSNGWTLNFTLVNPVVGAADLGLYMAASKSLVLLSNLTYTLTVVNFGPAAATNIVVTNPLPAGVAFVSMSAPAGTTANTNVGGTLVWSIPSLTTNATNQMTFVVKGLLPGQLTNVAAVVGGSTDLDPDNDIAAQVTLVEAPSADLAMLLSASPNPAYLGQNVTNTLTITNRGPGTAVGVTAIDYLPAGVTLVSISPEGYVIDGSMITFTNLGMLGSGDAVQAVVVFHPTVEGLFSDMATCSSLVTDPRKLNNTATVKTVVAGMLIFRQEADNLVLTWRTSEAAVYTIESTTDLGSGVWTPVAIAPVINTDGFDTVAIPIDSAVQFYRLRASLP